MNCWMSLVPKPQDPKDWRRMKTRMNSDLQNTQTKESSGEKSDVMISWKKPSFLSHGEPHCKSESNTRTGIDEGKSTVKHREVRKTKEGKTLWWRWKKNGTSRSTVLKHEAKQNPAHCVPFFFFLLQFIENRLQTLFAVILQYRDTLIHVRIEW